MAPLSLDTRLTMIRTTNPLITQHLQSETTDTAASEVYTIADTCASFSNSFEYTTATETRAII